MVLSLYVLYNEYDTIFGTKKKWGRKDFFYYCINMHNRVELRSLRTLKSQFLLHALKLHLYSLCVFPKNAIFQVFKLSNEEKG